MGTHPIFESDFDCLTENMSGTRRLTKEYNDLQSSKLLTEASVKALTISEQSILAWSGVLQPSERPYDQGAFKFKLTFPAEYPFKPPKVLIETKIYHPNIDEKGQVCLPIIAPENWKPATKVEHVLISLIALIEKPEPDHPLRSDIAQVFQTDHAKFLKTASDFTKKHAEPR